MLKRYILWTLFVLAILPLSSVKVFAQDVTPTLESCELFTWYEGLAVTKRMLLFTVPQNEVTTCEQLQKAYSKSQESERMKIAQEIIAQSITEEKLSECANEQRSFGDLLVDTITWHIEWVKGKTLEQIEQLAPSIGAIGEAEESYCYTLQQARQGSILFQPQHEIQIVHNGNLRAGIGTTFKILGVVYAGETVTLFGSNNGDGTWFLVKSSQGVGWVRYNLTNQQPITETIYGGLSGEQFPTNEVLKALAKKTDLATVAHPFAELYGSDLNLDPEQYTRLFLAFYTDGIRLWVFDREEESRLWVCPLPEGYHGANTDWDKVTFDSSSCELQPD